MINVISSAVEIGLKLESELELEVELELEHMKIQTSVRVNL